MNKLNAPRDSGMSGVMVRYAYNVLDRAREAHADSPSKAMARKLEKAELGFAHCIILEKFDPIPPLGIVDPQK